MVIGIVSTFAVSIVCFVFSYLSVTRDEAFLTLTFLGIGVVLAGCGVYFTTKSRN